MAKNRLQDRGRREPIEIIYGHDDEVVKWVGRELHEEFINSRGIGFAYCGKLIGGIVYHQYRPPSIEMSIATLDPRWANRRTLEAAFIYPFIQLGVKRITVMTGAENHPVREFQARLGFVYEATLKDALHDGDAALSRMLPGECKWIRARKYDGKGWR